MLVYDDAIPARIKCSNGCGRRMTWAETRVQYGRMIKRGCSVEESKRRSPICGKCVTATMPLVRNGPRSTGM
jgi:hypothetical protein